VSCLSCASENQVELPSEMFLHFPGLTNLDKPSVWIFPKVLVCFECGFSQFITPKAELALLARGAGAKGASA
jgi:hypothetical protein